MPHLRPQLDFIDILERAYAFESDERRWARELSAVVLHAMEGGVASGAVAVAHGDDWVDATPAFHVCTDSQIERMTTEMWHTPAADALRGSPEVMSLFYPGRPYTTHREIEQRASPQMGKWLQMARAGAPDACAFFAYPAPGLAVVQWTLLGNVRSYARGELKVLNRIATHVDSAFRLRASPEAVIAAVVAPNGRLLDLEDHTLEPNRGALAAKLVSVERSRRRAQRRKPEALEGWQGLIAGKFSVVPREDADGKRYYLLVANGPLARAHARLAPLEVDVLALAARGFSGKGTAYALGLGESTVSNALARAAKKLGLRSRSTLIQAASALFGATKQVVDQSGLSAAERDVLELLRRGLSNAEIAALRSRSPNTIANQVSSILRKTGSDGRRRLFPLT